MERSSEPANAKPRVAGEKNRLNIRVSGIYSQGTIGSHEKIANDFASQQGVRPIGLIAELRFGRNTE